MATRVTLALAPNFADLADLDGLPDGATVDFDGFYWLAAVRGGRLYRFAPNGRLDRTIELPISSPTRPMFGGADLDRLFVTSIRVDGEALRVGSSSSTASAAAASLNRVSLGDHWKCNKAALTRTREAVRRNCGERMDQPGAGRKGLALLLDVRRSFTVEALAGAWASIPPGAGSALGTGCRLSASSRLSKSHTPVHLRRGAGLQRRVEIELVKHQHAGVGQVQFAVPNAEMA